MSDSENTKGGCSAVLSSADVGEGTEVIKYRTQFNKIEALEVERETDRQVVLPARDGFRSRRENKVSAWSNWHDTWEAAHAFLVAKAERDVETLRVRLEKAMGTLEQIKGMTPNT